MDATNLAEARDHGPSTADYTAPVKTDAPAAPAAEQPKVDIAPKPPVWQKAFGELQTLNTQAGALVSYKNGLVFIPGCHVTDLNIFELDAPEAPVRRLGRPKGSKNKVAKRIGRPKGSKNKAKRGPGRPKGKRGPGRPKGSKNKK